MNNPYFILIILKNARKIAGGWGNFRYVLPFLMVLLLPLLRVEAQTTSATVQKPVHGYFAFTGHLAQSLPLDHFDHLLLTDTFTGEASLLLEDDRWVDSIIWNPQGTGFAYRHGGNSQASTTYDLQTQASQVLHTFSGANGLYFPVGWSLDGSNLLYLHSSFELIPGVSYTAYDSLELMNIGSGDLTPLLSFEIEEILDNLPLPPGIDQMKFEAISSVSRNPVYDEWLVIQMRVRVPGQLNEDTGEEWGTYVSLLYNYQTGQFLSLDQLFTSPILPIPARWRADGKRLALSTFDDIAHIVAFHDTGGGWDMAVVASAPMPYQIETWLGAGNVLIVSSGAAFYLAEIMDGHWDATEFFVFSSTVLSYIGEGDWYLTASEAEKRELSCLFDQTLPTQLQVGGRARVAFTDGTSSRLWSEPGLEGAEVTLKPEGTEFDVIDGATCIDGYRWWQLELDNAVIGWASESDTTQYFLEPVTVSQPMSLTITVPPTDETTLITQDDTRFQAVADGTYAGGGAGGC